MVRLAYNAPYNWFSVFCHIALGLLAGVLAGLFKWFGLALAVFIFVMFFLYEYFEERKIQDEMFYELREFVLGFCVGLILSLVLTSSPP
jgi:hypothetical protein